MLTFISISLTLLFIFEVTWRMEHSRYFFSSRIAFFIHLVKIRHFATRAVNVAWPYGYNVEIETSGCMFDSHRNYRQMGRILEDTMRMFFCFKTLHCS